MTGLLGDPSIATASLIDATLYCTLNGICSFPSRKRKRAQSPRRMTASYFPARPQRRPPYLRQRDPLVKDQIRHVDRADRPERADQRGAPRADTPDGERQ